MKMQAITMILAMTAAAIASNVHAQTGMRDKVLMELARNDVLLADAKRLVMETNSVKARALLKTSATIQMGAKNLFQKSEDNYQKGWRDLAEQQMLKARELAYTARESILRTMALAKRESRIEDNTLKTMERAAKSLERAMGMLAESSGPEAETARKLIEEARMQLGRARNNMREHMYEVAFRLAKTSDSLSLRAIRIMKHEIKASDEVAREIKKTARLLAKIEERGKYMNNDRAARLYRRATELQAGALQKMEANRLEAALELTKRARRLAMDVLKTVSSQITPENVEQALRLTDNLIAKAEEMLNRGGPGEGAGLLEDAKRLQRRAKDRFRDGQLDAAVRSTRRAREMLSDVLAHVGRPLKRELVRSALEETDRLIHRIKNEEASSKDDLARKLIERAEEHQEKAWNAFEREGLKRALTQTRVARNLARKAAEQMKNEGI